MNASSDPIPGFQHDNVIVVVVGHEGMRTLQTSGTRANNEYPRRRLGPDDGRVVVVVVLVRHTTAGRGHVLMIGG